MGRDAMSVVDSKLKVYGVEGLRIADASILPRVTTGNTMAPCVMIGEQAAAFLQRETTLSTALGVQQAGSEAGLFKNSAGIFKGSP